MNLYSHVEAAPPDWAEMPRTFGQKIAMESQKPEPDWDNWDFCIRIAGNTGPRALLTLWQKGYDIRHWTIERGKDDYQEEFEAKKDGRLFSATTPEELLGLVSIWETRGEDWRDASDDEWNKYERLMDEARIYDRDGNDVTDDD